MKTKSLFQQLKSHLKDNKFPNGYICNEHGIDFAIAYKGNPEFAPDEKYREFSKGSQFEAKFDYEGMGVTLTIGAAMKCNLPFETIAPQQLWDAVAVYKSSYARASRFGKRLRCWGQSIRCQFDGTVHKYRTYRPLTLDEVAKLTKEDCVARKYEHVVVEIQQQAVVDESIPTVYQQLNEIAHSRFDAESPFYINAQGIEFYKEKESVFTALGKDGLVLQVPITSQCGSTIDVDELMFDDLWSMGKKNHHVTTENFIFWNRDGKKSVSIIGIKNTPHFYDLTLDDMRNFTLGQFRKLKSEYEILEIESKRDGINWLLLMEL